MTKYSTEIIRLNSGEPTGDEPHAQTAVAIPVAVDNVSIYDSGCPNQSCYATLPHRSHDKTLCFVMSV